jgi:hypothetical protein
MKYMLLQYANPADAPHYTPEQAQIGRQEWFALLEEMKTAGVYLHNYGLAPVTDAKTVRVRNAIPLITDGPFADTNEHLGGYFMLECKDLDEALSWAVKIPYARNGGMIEIRPVIVYTQDMRDQHARDGKTTAGKL